MKEKNFREICYTILGILIITLGFVLMKRVNEPQGIMQTLPYILVGVGCGIFGHNIGGLISHKVTEKNPELARNIEIEKKDERNIAISDKSKARAYDNMVYVYSAILLAFALMQVDLKFIIILVIAYLYVVFSGIYYRFKYDKEL